MPSCLDIGRGGGIAYKPAERSLLPRWQWLLGDGSVMHTITAGPRCPWCPGLSVSFSELSPSSLEQIISSAGSSRLAESPGEEIPIL